MSWTDERVELLKKLWSDGLSASQIAAELGGITRNAVIGKVHRLGLPGRTKFPLRGARGEQKQKPKPKRLVKRFSNHSNRFDVVDINAPAPLPMMPLPQIGARRLTLLQLDNSTCHWPFGEPQSPDFFFCGGDAVEGKPYCAQHCRVAYQPAKR